MRAKVRTMQKDGRMNCGEMSLLPAHVGEPRVKEEHSHEGCRQVTGAHFDRPTQDEEFKADVERFQPAQWRALDDAPIGFPAWSLLHLFLRDPYECISTPELQVNCAGGLSAYQER